MKKLIFLILLLPDLLLAQSSLRLPSILSDHMVLQQSAEVKLWGWANPRTTISITMGWNTDTITVQASNKAKWEAMIHTPKSGGPYEINITAKDENINIKDVLIGELWLCSGQSNMEYSADKGVEDAKEALSNCENKEIRFFYVEKATADYPQEDCIGSWKVCDMESMRRFSAVGYFFGKKIHVNLNAPVGLINSNWGGTPVETWTPEKDIQNVEKVKEKAQYLKKSSGWNNTIGGTYNAMIHPLLKLKITGVIWYQGEANCPNAYSYNELLTNMIQSWREGFQADLPFYYVQIAPYLRYPIPYSAAIVREQQEQVMALENTGMVVISDQVDDLKDIHPKYKKEVGYRLANYALAETYGKKVAKYQFATFKQQRIEKDKIIISFDHVGEGITFRGDRIEGLEIAGEDHKFYSAKGSIDSDSKSLIISSKEVKKPMFVRYAFGNGLVGNLFDKAGLPVAPFRTDRIVYSIEQKGHNGVL